MSFKRGVEMVTMKTSVVVMALMAAALLVLPPVSPQPSSSLTLTSPVTEDGSYIAEAGEDVSITCTAEGIIKWYKNGEELRRDRDYSDPQFGVMNNLVISDTVQSANRQSSTLTVSKASYRDVGSYRCEISTCHQEGCHYSEQLYLYVRDMEHLIPFKPVAMLSYFSNDNYVIIPCKPSFPDVQVTLMKPNLQEKEDYSRFTETEGFTFDVRRLFGVRLLTCEGTYESLSNSSKIKLRNMERIQGHPSISVRGKSFWQQNFFNTSQYDVLKGGDLTMQCSVSNMMGSPLPHWTYEDRTKGIKTISNGQVKSLRFEEINARHSGAYLCYGANGFSNSTVEVAYVNVLEKSSAILEISNASKDIALDEMDEVINWFIPVRTYPMPALNWSRSDGELILSLPAGVSESRYLRYYMNISLTEGLILLQIKNPSMRDIGQYRLRASVSSPDANKNIVLEDTFNLTIKGAPEDVSVTLKTDLSIVGTDEVVAEGYHVKVNCTAWGYPAPLLTLYFVRCRTRQDCDERNQTLIPDHKKLRQIGCATAGDPTCQHTMARSEDLWEITANSSGYFLCLAKNEIKETLSGALNISLTDSDNSVHGALSLEVSHSNRPKSKSRYDGGSLHVTSILEDSSVTLTCRSNTYLLANVYPALREGEVRGCNSTTSQHRSQNHGCIWNGDLMNSSHSSTSLSLLTTAVVPRLSKTPACKCYGCYIASSNASPAVNASVLSNTSVSVAVLISEKVAPKYSISLNGSYSMNEHEGLDLRCNATGNPPPRVFWKKDGDVILPDEEPERILIDEKKHVLSFVYLTTSDTGRYECLTRPQVGFPSISQATMLNVSDPEQQILLYLVLGISIVLGICIFCIVVKLVITNEKRKKTLREQHDLFIRGDVENLNPDLGIDEQAELLPYHKNFEFPRENIVSEKLLGSGAFGRVYMAKAKNIIKGEPETTVAIKMSKSRTDHQQLKALRSEIKIMMNIGRHVNIVNLLGACSANMASKGELCLIVEYCRHGNILSFMRHKKESFVNLIEGNGRIQGQPYNTFARSMSRDTTVQYINTEHRSQSSGSVGSRQSFHQSVFTFPRNGNQRKISSSSRSEPPQSPRSPVEQQDSCDEALKITNSSNGISTSNPMPIVNSTDEKHFVHEFQNSENEIKSALNCQVDQEPIYSNDNAIRTHNESMQRNSMLHQDQSYVSEMNQSSFDDYGNSPDGLAFNTKTLLSWCYQIANGMEFLSSSKVLHGDLAARNILLADNNVVKISDFGMAKDIYKDDQYTKKSKVPMPIKWMALEAIIEGTHSTQSDVWAFGVVMWEIFTLGMVPYPTTNLEDVLSFLREGGRLDKPQYATDNLYSIMWHCWNENPRDRPLFDQLAKHLGKLMEVHERQFYLDLNKPNMEVMRANSILNKIRGNDIRCLVPTDTYGYLCPNENSRNTPVSWTHSETSAGSMSRKNILNLSIQTSHAQPDEITNQEEYLEMRKQINSPSGPCSSANYTNMSRSASYASYSGSSLTSPTNYVRASSSSPLRRQNSKFPFPPPKATYLTDDQMCLRSLPQYDSGVYSPTTTTFENTTYFLVSDLPSAKSNGKVHLNGNAPMLRATSLPYDSDNSAHDYQNLPTCKPNRVRSTSETSSGLGSIKEDPSRESLLKSSCKQLLVHACIPEEQSLIQESAV